MNINILYEIINFHNINSYPTLENSLSGAVKLTKNTDIDKYRYFGYGIGFDWHGFYPRPSGGTGRNERNFAVDMSLSVHANN